MARSSQILPYSKVARLFIPSGDSYNPMGNSRDIIDLSLVNLGFIDTSNQYCGL